MPRGNNRRWLVGGLIAAALSGVAYLFVGRPGTGGVGGADVSSGPLSSSDAYRARVVALAKAEVGKADLDRYFASACPPCVGSHPEWCGIFALYILRQAGLTDWQWRVGSGFLERKGGLVRTNDPKPGDMAYFNSNQHHAIVVGVRGDTVDLVNGNGQGGVVTESSPSKGKAAAYYSIQPLIDAALKLQN